MLLTFGVVSALLWLMDSYLDFVWFNETGRSFGYYLLPLDNVHEIYMRGLLVCLLMFGGAVVFISL